MKISLVSCTNNLITCKVEISTNILFDLDFQLNLFTKDSHQQSFHIRQQGWDIAWLPSGVYVLYINLNESLVLTGKYSFSVMALDNANVLPKLIDQCEGNIQIESLRKVLFPNIHWNINSDNIDLPQLSWRKGHSDWFYRHFDHASRVIKELMFNNSEKLKGKILDVGCGDGITDLGLYLRTNPELLVGIDPFEGFKNLRKFCEENHLPNELISHENLVFSNASGNQIPYEDNTFDVVLSWGSFEHIAGGYQQTLAEITRVLKVDGVLFAHPGLFYGDKGNHLGEFFSDPFIHLKIPEKELHTRLMNAKPNYMDRVGQTFPAEDYWQWYKELNPITVESLEKELRELGYEPWRVALRSSNIIEYTNELQKYSMNDLAISEMYTTFILKSK